MEVGADAADLPLGHGGAPGRRAAGGARRSPSSARQRDLEAPWHREGAVSNFTQRWPVPFAATAFWPPAPMSKLRTPMDCFAWT